MLHSYPPPDSVPAMCQQAAHTQEGRWCLFIPFDYYISRYKLGSWPSNKKFLIYLFVGIVFLVFWFPSLAGRRKNMIQLSQAPLLTRYLTDKIESMSLRQRLKLWAKVH